MSTIKELAETCGVSEQAIRKWCARNQVAKDVAQRYIIDNERGAGRKKALSEDQIAEFEKLLQQGAGEKQLRERFGLSRSSYFLYKKRLAEKQ